jgi:hypothetical protein
MKTLPCIVLCLSLALLASCSDDGIRIVKPKPETDPPLAQVADLPDTLHLMSDDPNARAAQAWAAELFLAVWREAGMARAALYPSRFLTWSRTDDGCWRCSYGFGADTLSRDVYRACPNGNGHEWRFDYRQWCAPEVICGYYPIARGTTGPEGITGAFSQYSRYDSTQVTFSWTWRVESGGEAIRWTFYRGEIEPGAQSATMNWSVWPEGGSAWIWTWPNDEKWTMWVMADPSFGRLVDYLWNDSTHAFRLAHIINWEGGHGTWDKYNSDEQIIETLSW